MEYKIQKGRISSSSARRTLYDAIVNGLEQIFNMGAHEPEKLLIHPQFLAQLRRDTAGMMRYSVTVPGAQEVIHTPFGQLKIVVNSSTKYWEFM